jgi:hypothetical protein
MMKKTLLYTLIIAIVGITAFSIFEQTTKDKVPGKLKRLPCHKNITAFERAYGDSELSQARQQLQSGNYIIKSDIDKATYMKSTLFNFVSVEDTDQYLYNTINNKIDKKRVFDNGVTVEYTIFENDVEDPKKKSDKCKLYRGYVVFKVKNSKKKTLYQVQIDFMDREGKDIPQTLDCAFESFLTY